MDAPRTFWSDGDRKVANRGEWGMQNVCFGSRLFCSSFKSCVRAVIATD
jgi:hypothetical protein